MSERMYHAEAFHTTTRWLILLACTIFALSGAPLLAGEIDACKYLIVMDFTSDPYGIGQELRTQARAKGFVVISRPTEVSQAELAKTCVMTGSWSANPMGGGQLAVRVVDAESAALVAETRVARSWTRDFGRALHGTVEKIYAQLGYKGFEEEAYRARIERVYPTRPKLAVTEAEVMQKQPGNQVEGIWSDPEDHYRLAIVPAPKGNGADFVGVVLRSTMPLWQPGEIKAEIRSTASAEIFTCTYFMAGKQQVGTTLTLDRGSVLRGSVKPPGSTGPTELILLRVWPKGEAQAGRSSDGKAAASGTGFLVSRSGLLATNWHVVADAKTVEVAFPEWKESVRAEVVIRDATNDLALLRLADATKLASTCPDMPFQLVPSGRVTLGQRVSTIGYPLSSILGSNPKFSEGVVASKTGLQDDPRTFQVSAEVQPGSSGSPLLDGEGNVVGVVVATLDAGRLYKAVGALPQNVNYAIKTDYLLNLIGMLPSEAAASRATAFSPEKAAKCVAIVRAW